MCASSYDSCKPVHKRTLCRNDVISRVLLTVYSSISTFIAYAQSLYAIISSSIHVRLFGSMRYCMLIWWGWKPKIYLLSEPPSTRIAFLYVRALGHNNGSNNGSEVCASSKCPDETVHLHRLV